MCRPGPHMSVASFGQARSEFSVPWPVAQCRRRTKELNTHAPMQSCAYSRLQHPRGSSFLMSIGVFSVPHRIGSTNRGSYPQWANRPAACLDRRHVKAPNTNPTCTRPSFPYCKTVRKCGASTIGVSAGGLGLATVQASR